MGVIFLCGEEQSVWTLCVWDSNAAAKSLSSDRRGGAQTNPSDDEGLVEGEIPTLQRLKTRRRQGAVFI